MNAGKLDELHFRSILKAFKENKPQIDSDDLVDFDSETPQEFPLKVSLGNDFVSLNPQITMRYTLTKTTPKHYLES